MTETEKRARAEFLRALRDDGKLTQTEWSILNDLYQTRSPEIVSRPTHYEPQAWPCLGRQHGKDLAACNAAMKALSHMTCNTKARVLATSPSGIRLVQVVTKTTNASRLFSVQFRDQSPPIVKCYGHGHPTAHGLRCRKSFPTPLLRTFDLRYHLRTPTEVR